MALKLNRRQALGRTLLGGVGGMVAAGLARTSLPTAQAQDAESDALASGMTRAAEEFLASLAGDVLTRATYAFDDAERLRWHWTTPDRVPRNGLPLAEMTADQRALALGLLEASLSAAGYAKALDIVSLQTDLGQNPTLYYVTVFGTPGGDEPWGWRFEGHHLSRHFTVAGDQVGAAPFFHGAWPTTTAAGLQAMRREEEAAREVIRSLDDTRRDAAIFQVDSLTDHVTQNEPEVAPLESVGILVGDLDEAQQELVDEIVETYLGSLPESMADAALARVRDAGLENARFGWAGSLDPGVPHYYRLQGPTFLLEFDNSRNSATHIHSVWRDFEEDFGRHLLG